MCLFIPGCAGPRRCPQAFSSWGAGVAPSRGAQVLVCAGSVVGTQALSPGSMWSLSFGTSDRARVPGTGSGHLTPGPAGKPREGSRAWAPRLASTSWSQNTALLAGRVGVNGCPGGCGPGLRSRESWGPLYICPPSTSPPPSATPPLLILRPSLLRPSFSCCLSVRPSKGNLAVEKK